MQFLKGFGSIVINLGMNADENSEKKCIAMVCSSQTPYERMIGFQTGYLLRSGLNFARRNQLSAWFLLSLIETSWDHFEDFREDFWMFFEIFSLEKIEKNCKSLRENALKWTKEFQFQTRKKSSWDQFGQA